MDHPSVFGGRRGCSCWLRSWHCWSFAASVLARDPSRLITCCAHWLRRMVGATPSLSGNCACRALCSAFSSASVLASVARWCRHW